MRFFAKVPWYEFLFGLNWEPQIAIRSDQVAGHGSFGAVPVFLGTVVIAVIAMLVATPIGLLSAIYLTEYATPRFRAVAKPTLEVLADIPTVVYGFFAILTVRSEEHTSELQSLMRISYAVFCLKKKTDTKKAQTDQQHTH